MKVAGSSAPVTKLDFCSISLRLAVGNGCGLVRFLTGCFIQGREALHYIIAYCIFDFSRFVSMTSKAVQMGHISTLSQKLKMKVI